MVAANAAEKPVALIIAQGGSGDQSTTTLPIRVSRGRCAENKLKAKRSNRKTSSHKPQTFCVVPRMRDLASSSISNIHTATPLLLSRRTTPTPIM